MRCVNIIKHFKANISREIAKKFITVKYIPESRSERREENGSCKSEDLRTVNISWCSCNISIVVSGESGLVGVRVLQLESESPQFKPH